MLEEWVQHLHTLTRALHQRHLVQIINDTLLKEFDDQNAEEAKIQAGDVDDKTSEVIVEDADDQDPHVGENGATSNQEDQGEIKDSDRDADFGDSVQGETSVQINRRHPELVTRIQIDVIAKHIADGTIIVPSFTKPINVQHPFEIQKRYSILSKQLKELTTMCFEFNVHGKVTDYFSPYPEIKSPNSLVIASSVDQEQTPEELNSELSELSYFLKCYFCWMDPVRIRQAILWSSQDQRRILWDAYLELSEG